MKNNFFDNLFNKFFQNKNTGAEFFGDDVDNIDNYVDSSWSAAYCWRDAVNIYSCK